MVLNALKQICIHLCLVFITGFDPNMRAKQTRQATNRRTVPQRKTRQVVKNSTEEDNENDDQNEDESSDQMNGQIDVQMNGSDSVETIVSKKEIHSPKTPTKPLTERSVTDLLRTITENDTYFSSLIDLIPPKIYFEGNEEILESMESQKKQRMADKVNLSSKAKQKLFKLDPKSDQRVSEIANQFYGKTRGKKNELNSKPNNNSMDNKMQELRHKLNEKITQLKSNRGQKTNAKQLRESKKQRKRENAMRATKQKGFAKRQITAETTDEVDANGVQPKSKKRKTDDNNNEETDTKKATKSAIEKMPKIYNKEGNIVYSKFDLVSPNGSTKDRKPSKKNKLKKLLHQTKKEEQKMSTLETSDANKAKEVKQKKLWRNAIEKSEGIKVKNNSKLIEKSVKRREKMKKKSSKQWEERKESLDNRMKSANDKRQRNIDKRTRDKKEHRIKRNKKKGRIFDIKN